MRSLPAAIGPAENALRAVLLRELAGSPFHGYPEWVAINVIERAVGEGEGEGEGEGGEGEGAAAELAKVLRVDPQDVGAILAGLHSRGLTEPTAHGWRCSVAGREALEQARDRVARVTDRVVGMIPAADIETALRVLDQVTAQAQRELAGPEPISG